INISLCVGIGVGLSGAGTGGDVPAVRIFGVDGQRPSVVTIASLVGRRPAASAIPTPCSSAAAGLISPFGRAWMPRECVNILFRAGAMILPRLAAVLAQHQSAQLNADNKQARIFRVGRDAADMRCLWARWKAPGLRRRQ